MNHRLLPSLCYFLLIAALLILSGCSYHPADVSDDSIQNINKSKPHYSSIKKGQIEYFRFGAGSPIILIPGYATDITSWNRQFLAALAQHHQIIVFNNRNVGGSHIDSSTYSTKALANDIYQLMQALQLKKPTVIGISMGGMIAQQLAVLHADKLSHLVLINTSIAGSQAVHPSSDVEKMLRNMSANKFKQYFVALRLFFPASWKIRMSYSLVFDRFQPLHYQEAKLDAVLSKQRKLIMNWIHDDETAPKLKKLNLPVLILNGESDTVIPPENSLILAKTIPKAHLLRWQEGGHAMIYQYPNEMAMTINQFIH